MMTVSKLFYLARSFGGRAVRSSCGSSPKWTTLRNLIEVLARRGEQVAVAQLLGAAQSSATASSTYGAEAVRLERAAVALRAHLGKHFEIEVGKGRGLGDGGAVRLALEIVG